MRVTAVAGDIAYLGGSRFLLRNKEGVMEEKYISKVGMIAAGSGLTPMFQLIQTVADERLGVRDTTSLSLIYSCASPVSLLKFESINIFSLTYC